MDKKLNNEIPENVRLKLDDTYKQILESKNVSKINLKKVGKVATVAATITTLTLTTGFALEYIIDYFKVNEDSKYISTKEIVNSLNKAVNLSVTDKNIEFIVDSISADDNFINIFYTIKSDKNIKDIDENFEDPFFAAPHIWTYSNGKEAYELGMIEIEASYVSDKELKCIRRINITNLNLPNKFDLDLKVDEIFRQEGKWEISVKVDKTDAVNSTKKYDINKDIIINKTYETYEGDNDTIDVDHKVTIDKVVMSPIANQIVIKEKVKRIKKDMDLSAGDQFALFDQDGVQLEVIDKGLSGPDKKGIQINSFEFIKGDKNITSLKYVPINFKDGENDTIVAQSIDKLPMEFKVSEYGKWIIDKVEIKDSEMLIHGRKEGFVYGALNVTDCDENGKWLEWNAEVAPTVDVAIDRNNNNQIYSIKFKEKYKDEIKNIKSIEMCNDNVELMMDQAVEIDLSK